MLWRSSRTLWRTSTACSKNLGDLARLTHPKLPSLSSLRKIHTTSPRQERVTHAQLKDGVRDQDLKEPIRIQGLVRSIRKQKRIAFASISDGTTHDPVHAVLTPNLVSDITNGSYVDVTGRWEDSPGKGQSHDLQVDSVNEIGHADAEEHPIQKKLTSTEFLRSIPHLRMRTQLGNMTVRARAQLISGVADYFENGSAEPAIQVHPPVITSSDCEGAGEVFTIVPAAAVDSVPSNPPGTDTTLPPAEGTGSAGAAAREEGTQHFFGGPKYLTVSNQLHLEAWSAELGNVWALAPTFRAEASETPRHLAEFYMLEAEFRGTSKLEDVIGHAEALIRHVASKFSTSRVGKELQAYYTMQTKPTTTNEVEPLDLSARWNAVLDPEPWLRLTYTSAIELLQLQVENNTAIFEFQPSWEEGLALEHEKYLVEHIAQNRPLIITDYPAAQKPFYMLRNEIPGDDDASLHGPAAETAACFDILLPFGYAEVCGGSLREHRLQELVEAMREKGLLKGKNKDSTQPLSKSTSAVPVASMYPHLRPGESLGMLQWYADLRRFGASPHGGFGIGFDRLLAYLVGVANVRDVVGFPRGWKHCHC